jgi:hypothetical protein
VDRDLLVELAPLVVTVAMGALEQPEHEEMMAVPEGPVLLVRTNSINTNVHMRPTSYTITTNICILIFVYGYFSNVLFFSGDHGQKK